MRLIKRKDYPNTEHLDDHYLIMYAIELDRSIDIMLLCSRVYVPLETDIPCLCGEEGCHAKLMMPLIYN